LFTADSYWSDVFAETYLRQLADELVKRKIEEEYKNFNDAPKEFIEKVKQMEYEFIENREKSIGDLYDDYVVDYNISRARDVHESNVPIGGSQSPQVVINLDNTNKDWNIFNNSSLFGKYMKKDLKINVSTGWRIKKTNAVTLQTKLRSTFSNVSTTMIVDDSSIFPEGGTNNNFIAIINPENVKNPQKTFKNP
jgi:hypothetical protein